MQSNSKKAELKKAAKGIEKKIDLQIKQLVQSLNGVAGARAEAAYQVQASYFIAWGFPTQKEYKEHLKRIGFSYWANKSGAGFYDLDKDGKQMETGHFVPAVWCTLKEGEARGLTPCTFGTISKDVTRLVDVEKFRTVVVPKLGKNGKPTKQMQKVSEKYTAKEPQKVTLYAHKREKWTQAHLQMAWMAWISEEDGLASMVSKFEHIAKDNKQAETK